VRAAAGVGRERHAQDLGLVDGRVDERPRRRELKARCSAVSPQVMNRSDCGAPWQLPLAHPASTGWTSRSNAARLATNTGSAMNATGSKLGGSADVHAPSPWRGGDGGRTPFSVAPFSIQLSRIRYASEPGCKMPPPACSTSRSLNSSP
jgi:hypothetical protein